MAKAALTKHRLLLKKTLQMILLFSRITEADGLIPVAAVMILTTVEAPEAEIITTMVQIIPVEAATRITIIVETLEVAIRVTMVRIIPVAMILEIPMAMIPEIPAEMILEISGVTTPEIPVMMALAAISLMRAAETKAVQPSRQALRVKHKNFIKTYSEGNFSLKKFPSSVTIQS